MNDINKKLESNNPVHISQVISQIAEVILKKYDKNKNNTQDIPEYKFLVEKCCVSDPFVNKTASLGILKLINAGILEISPGLFSYFVSLSTHAKDNSGIVNLIQNLFKKQLNEKDKYNLISPQHPFVSVLIQDKDKYENIFSCIKYYDRSTSDEETLEPLYYYIYFEPGISKIFRQKLWTFLVNNQTKNFILQELLFKLLKWMKLRPKENLVEVNNFAIEVLGYEAKIVENSEKIDVLLLFLTSLLLELLSNKIEAIDTIKCLTKIIKENKEKLYSVNCILLLLADCITIAPVTTLPELIKLGSFLITSKNLNFLALQSIQAAILPWIISPIFLEEETIKEAQKIFIKNQENLNKIFATKEIESSKYFALIKTSTRNISLYTSLCLVTESWKTEFDIINYLEQVGEAPIFFLKRLFNFFTALFMADFEDVTINLKSLNLLKNILDENKTITHNLLLVILYKLSKTTNSRLHFQLLKFLPVMAADKNNFQLILSTLVALSKGPHHLRNFVMVLFYDLWILETKCYPYLEKMLVLDVPQSDFDFQITRAQILKDICLKRPAVYGKEMVAHFSKILNECTGEDNAIPCALAFKGIKILCKSGIIDIATTWDALAPSFKNETRILVIQNFCNLLAEVPNLIDDQDEANSKFFGEVLSQLWEFATMNNNVEVIDASLKALSKFTLEQISEYLPEIYKEGVNQADSPFTFVSGECWIKFLQLGNYSAINVLGDFLISLVNSEISEYRKNTYEVTQEQREPVNFDYLPKKSVVRAIGNYLRVDVQKWQIRHKIVYLQCLRVFSHEYKRPLPPFQWNFLQELVHEPETRYFCIKIACKQVILSGTARRFMENLIVALIEVHNDDDILVIYENFKYLCNSIQPTIMRPFIEKTVNSVIETKNYKLLEKMLNSMKKTLGNTEMNDANKTVIIGVLSAEIDKNSANEKVFNRLLNCVTVFPKKQIEILSNPDNITNITADKFKICLKIRCAIAMDEANLPLDNLNEIFYYEDCYKLSETYIFTDIKKVLNRHKTHKNNVNWVLNLLGKIQMELTDAEKFSKQINFLFDVFILAVVIFSGYNTFSCEKSRINYFPESLKLLTENEDWKTHLLQILECLHHVINLDFIPLEYKRIFLESLACLRDEECFQKNLRWLKYLNNYVNIHT